MINSGFENRKCSFHMLPLMDVIFILLAFLVYSMSFMAMNKSVKVDLPKAFGTAYETGNTIKIIIDGENRLYLEKKEIPFQDIVSKISTEYVPGKNTVLISGDSRSDLGISLRLLGRLRKAKISPVFFECDEE